MQNLSDFYAEIKLLLHSLVTVLLAFRHARQRCLTNESFDYRALEHSIAKACAQLECSIHALLLSSFERSLPRILINGILHRNAGTHEATYYCQAGPFQVSRTLYRPLNDPNAKTIDLVSLRSGALKGGWLPATAQAMSFAVQQNPSREAAALSTQTNRLPYSRGSFERVAHLLAHRVIEKKDEIYEKLIEEYVVPEEATSLSVSLDRVSVPMEEPRPRPVGRPKKDAPKRPISRVYHMAYCGTLTLHDKEGKALYTIRYGEMPPGDPETLCEGLIGDARVILRQRPDLKVSLLCDGAKEMWSLLEEGFKQNAPEVELTRLVDLWHTLEKLGAAARLLVESASVEAKTESWRKQLLEKEGAVDKILLELRRSGKEYVKIGQKAPVHEAITYLENNKERMKYAEAKKKGLAVGSGNVEATCKNLFELRFKRCGARWLEESGQEIVELRAQALSERWEGTMSQVFAPTTQILIPCALAA